MTGSLANGTVGWDGDGGVFVDMGDLSNDGNSLVRVTLFRGRSPIDPQDQTGAQGHQILCRILEGVSFPSRGAAVLVGIPEPGGTTPGNAVIVGVINQKPVKNANAGPGDKVIAADAGHARIAALGNGTIVFVTSDDNTPDGNSIFLKIAPNELRFVAPWGVLVFDANGFRVRDSVSGAELVLGGIALPSPVSQLGSYARLTAANVYCDGTIVWLGPSTPASVWMSATFTPLDSPSPVALTAVAAASVRISVP